MIRARLRLALKHPLCSKDHVLKGSEKGSSALLVLRDASLMELPTTPAVDADADLTPWPVVSMDGQRFSGHREPFRRMTTAIIAS